MKQTEIPKDKIERYDTLLKRFPNVVRKGKNTPFALYNMQLFSFLTKDGVLALRLCPKNIAQFIQKHNGRPMLKLGRVMKGFVEVPETLWQNMDILYKYFQLSIAHTESLSLQRAM
jgi:hypothetical protein